MSKEVEDSNSDSAESNYSQTKPQARGSVKWFNDAKGFGFIEHEDGKDVFVHFSVIESEGFRTLKDGEEVLYDFTNGPKGLQATRVTRSTQTVTEQNSKTPPDKNTQEQSGKN